MSDKNKIAYYKGELNKHLENLKNKLKNVSINKISEIEDKITSIQDFYNSFFEGDESLEGKVRDIEHTIEKNEKEYKNIEEYHSKLLLGETSIKLEIELLLKELSGYKEKNIEINNYYKNLFEGIDENVGIVEQINSTKNSINEYKNRLFEGSESLEKKVDGLILKIEDYEEKYTDIINYHKELLEGDEESKSIQIKIQNVYHKLNDYKKELLDGVDGKKSIKEKIDGGYKKIKEYYDFIYGIEEEKDNKGKILIKGKNGYKEKLDNLYINKEKKYNELENKIEDLLPGATSAGLSSAYKNMKDSFKYPKNIWSGIFIVILLIGTGLGYGNNAGKTYEETILNILSDLPYILPLVWLAYFASKQQSQNSRLEQEYAHKESLAKSFEGYKKEIDKIGADEKSIEIKKMLMENIVKMTGENPSDTLDKNHGTNPPIWEYLFGGKEKK